MKYIVTGGAGYIGSHLCKALRIAGHEPIVVDNLSNGHEWAVKWGPLEIIDIRSTGDLSAVFNKYKPDGVFHFAGLILVGESIENPAMYYENNVIGTLNLLNVMKETDCRKIVFSSTCAVYGEPEKQPINEDTPQQPINPYGHSKQMVETVLFDFARAYDFQPAMLRYFNACGADPDVEIGEAHDPETHLIPRVFQAIDGQLDYFEIFGNDFPTKDGTAVRDYIHVCDLVDGHIAAMESLDKGHGPIACNLGTGKGTSVKEIIDAAEKITGKTAPVRNAPRREGDSSILIADTGLAKELLEFKPKFLDIQEILESAWNWHQHYFEKNVQ